MKLRNELKNLVAIPLAGISIFIAIILNNSSVLYFDLLIIYIAVATKFLLDWNSKLETEISTDFRFFYAAQKARVHTLALFLVAWTIGSFLAQENRLLGYVIYAIPFVYSSVSTEGIEVAKNSNLVEISPISSDADYWDENKDLCEQVIALYSDNKFIDKISKRYRYSSFLRTEEANLLLNEVINSQKNTTSDPTESLKKIWNRI